MPEGYQVGNYQNWFEITGQPNFAMMLWPFRGKPNLKFLQIGAFRGDSTVWMLENILIGPGCKLHDVDPWGKNEEYHDLEMLEDLDWENIQRDYHKRTSIWQEVGKLLPHRKTANEYFHTPPGRDLLFDFVYIDGAHDAVSVLEDAMHAYRVLKPRGLLAFDDYTWNARDNDPLKSPGPAIDAFRFLYAERMVVYIQNSQVWAMKVA